MIAQSLARIAVDSDLTPFSFARAHDQLTVLYWRGTTNVALDEFFDQHLVVSREEDLRTIETIQRMVTHHLPVTITDIPEFSWILFANGGKVAVYSPGA